MKPERLKIKEKVYISSLSALVGDEGYLVDFIRTLETITKENQGMLFLENSYEDIDIIKYTYRDETDREYGKRVAKETGEYNRYLKLKEKFEGK